MSESYSFNKQGASRIINTVRAVEGATTRGQRTPQILGGAKTYLFRLTNNNFVQSTEEEDPYLYYMPRIQARQWGSNTDETIHWLSCPTYVTADTLPQIRRVWAAGDFVLCSKWEGRYVIISEPRHTIHNVIYSTAQQKFTFTDDLVNYYALDCPFDQQAFLRDGSLYVIYNPGWTTLPWMALAALPQPT